MSLSQSPSGAPQPARKGGLRVSVIDDPRARRQRGIWRLLALGALLIGPLGWWLSATPEPPAGAGGGASHRLSPREAPRVASAEPIRPAPDPIRTATRQNREPPATPLDDTHLPSLDPNDLAAYVRPGDPEPSGAEVIRALHEAGIREGLGAFNPPGTVPLMSGIVVPDDFVLPPGYVRHYQVTDEGEMLPPVLMFSPDHDWRDGNGHPMPDDRLVPPEMAPPGMPIEPLPLPQPQPPQG